MRETVNGTALFLLCLLPAACGGAPADDSVGSSADDLTAGTNGAACEASPYNCKLRASGGNRVLTNAGSESWEVDTGVPVLDGDGNVLATQTSGSMAFNYGQERTFGGKVHVFAMATSNGSSGWFPLDAVKGASSLSAKMGHVSAHAAGLGELGCYEVRDSNDATLALKKVVYDADSTHERAGDYLPLVRANGKRSVNLAFNVPGFSLGGVSVDHFPAGTKFRRLDVPTSSGAPSIDVPLYVADAAGRYRKPSGTMKFVYGYVVASTGTKRVGWMAYDALAVSTGCP